MAAEIKAVEAVAAAKLAADAVERAAAALAPPSHANKAVSHRRCNRKNEHRRSRCCRQTMTGCPRTTTSSSSSSSSSSSKRSSLSTGAKPLDCIAAIQRWSIEHFIEVWTAASR